MVTTETSGGSIPSTGLACVLDAHSLRWRHLKVALGGPASHANSDATARRIRRWIEPCCPSRARLRSADELLWDPATDELLCPATDELLCGGERERRRRAGPFLGDELLGVEQLADALLGTMPHDTCFPSPQYPDDPVFYDSFPPPVPEDDMEVKILWEAPPALHTRLELLLSQDPKHVTALRMLACRDCKWDLRKLLPVGRSCVNLQSLSVVALPERDFFGDSYLYPEIVKQRREWAWMEDAQVEQMKQLITGCPHLRSLHFHLNTNEYLTKREEIFPLLSRLAHLSLPLADLPPNLLPHLSSLRSLRLSLSAPNHPLLLSGRPFHSLPLLSLLHLSLASPASGLSEPLSPDLFAGLEPSLRSLTFLVYAKQKEEGGGGDGGEGGMGRSGEEEEGGWVGDEWAREDEVVGWLPASLWSLTRLQHLSTNVGGAWDCTGLNTLFPPHPSHSIPPSSSCSCCCCCCCSSSYDPDPSSHQQERHHHQCFSSLPNLTSLSLLSHRTFPPCLSSLSSLTLLSIPLASPLLSPGSLALFSHWPRLSHLLVSGEGPAEPTFCRTKPGPTEPATGLTEPPSYPEATPSSSSLRHLTLVGTAGVIPLAVWGRLCPQLLSLKIQGSPHVAVRGWGEQLAEGSGKGSVGHSACGQGEGACGEGEGACGEGEGACGAAGEAAACFFPSLEELVLRNHRHTLAFMGLLPRLTHLAIDHTHSLSDPPTPTHAPTILPPLLPNLTFLRIHSPPPTPLPVLPHLRTLILGSYPHSSRFLASLALFPSLTALRIFNLSMHNYHSALSCPPSLKSLQICFSHLPLLPDSLRLFSSLTRLDLFQCSKPLALPACLSAFSSLAHVSFGPDYHDPVLPYRFQGYLRGKAWEREGGGEGEWEGKGEGEGEGGEEGGEEGEEEGEGVQGAYEVGVRGLRIKASAMSLQLPAEVLPAEVLPAEVLPAEVLPAEVLPAEVLPAEALPAEVLPAEWCHLHTSFFALAFHPLLLSCLPLALLHSPPPPPTLNPDCRGCSRRPGHEMPAQASSPLSSLPWHPAFSPFCVLLSSPISHNFSLLPSCTPPLTLPHPIIPSSLSSCFTHHYQGEWRSSAFPPIWLACLPSPSSLAHTLTLYPNLSALLLPIVSTAPHPLRPSHVRSLLSAAAALPALTTFSVLLEPGFSREHDWEYGRDELWEMPKEERKREMRRWWGETNREVERGLLAVLKRCRGLKELRIQGEGVAHHLKLPPSLFLCCTHLTTLSLPLSRLPSSLLRLTRLTSLSLALPVGHMPPQFAHSSPFACLSSLRSLSLHACEGDMSSSGVSLDGSSWSGLSEELLLGLPSCLSSLSLHLPTDIMPASFSSLTALTLLAANQWIPGLQGEEDEGDGGVGEEEWEGEEGEDEAEEESGMGEGDEDVWCDDHNHDHDGGEHSQLHNSLGASSIHDSTLLPLCNLTSLTLSCCCFFPPLIRHLTRLTSLSLGSYYDDGIDSTTRSCSLHHGLSRLTRLRELSLCCDSFSQQRLPRLPRLRSLHVQNYKETGDMTRFMAAVAHSLERLHIDCHFCSRARLCERGSNTGLSFRKLKLLHLECSAYDSWVDMSLFPALEHMVLPDKFNVNWEVERGFSSNLRFLQLNSVRLPKDPGDQKHELMQLTALTTLIVDNADYRDFLAALSCFSSLRTLRLSNITRGCSEPYFSCPPHLSTLQICFSDLPRLPPSLAHFSRLTRLDLLHWRHLHSLPPFLSSFSSLRHLKVTSDGLKPTQPACLKGFLRGRDWYEHSPCDGRDWHEHLCQ
ncbi:unnamed protein product [Closterium sp. NIES-54]